MNNKKRIKNFYTNYLNLYHFIFCKVFKYDKAIKNFIYNTEYLDSNFKILDAGCGTGIVTKALHDYATHRKLKNIIFSGFDITPAMLNNFNDWIDCNHINNIKLKELDTLDDNLCSNYSDQNLVVTSGMLEYLPKTKIETAIKNLLKCLKYDGTLLIIITKSNWLTNILIKKLWKANTYSKNEIIKILLNCNIDFNFKTFSSQYNYVNYWGYIIEIKKKI